MSTIQENENMIVEEFELFDDWMQKYDYLIELGNSLPIIEDEFKTEDYLIKGCQSRVWLNAYKENGLVYFKADSDAIITKGIVALLIQVLSGQKPEKIMESELFFIDQIGLKEHLSPTRSNGLVSMIKQMKMYAIALQDA